MWEFLWTSKNCKFDFQNLDKGLNTFLSTVNYANHISWFHAKTAMLKITLNEKTLNLKEKYGKSSIGYIMFYGI